MLNDDERIALFLDYENLAIGARDGLGVSPFDFGPVADALAERGRVVSRRAYADWSYFGDDRRLLARASVELMRTGNQITAEQRLGAEFFLDDNRDWGLGLSIITRRDDVASAPGRFGWEGGLGTSWHADPREEMTAILMTQSLGFPSRIDRDFLTLVYAALGA